MPTTPLVTHLLYLHGFRSSPQSTKAQAMAAAVQRHRPSVQWWCPQLPPSPAAAMRLLLDGLTDWPLAAKGSQLAIVGSSLGGFYAAVLARRLGCLTVLINPAAHPARDLARHLGTQTQWHDAAQTIFFQPCFIDELRDLGSGRIAAPGHNTLALIAQDDEVLDWREMATFCADAQVRLIQGSDHALSDFDAHLPTILDFLRLT